MPFANNYAYTCRADKDATAFAATHLLAENCDSFEWTRITNDEADEMTRQLKRFVAWMRQGVKA